MKQTSVQWCNKTSYTQEQNLAKKITKTGHTNVQCRYTLCSLQPLKTLKCAIRKLCIPSTTLGGELETNGKIYIYIYIYKLLLLLYASKLKSVAELTSI